MFMVLNSCGAPAAIVALTPDSGTKSYSSIYETSLVLRLVSDSLNVSRMGSVERL